MRLISFLFKCAPVPLVAAVLANILSGASTATLLFVTNAVLTDSTFDPTVLFFTFFALVVTLLCARAVSAYLAFDFSHRAILNLRTRLASLILRAPLSELESIRASTLLSAFTEDVDVVIGSLPGVPTIALNIAILVGCFTFMVWLLPPAGLVAIGLLVCAVIGYYLITRKAVHYFSWAQQAFDMMFGYFRALTEGIKELKLHRARRNVYFSEVFLPEAQAYRDHMFKATALHNAAHILIYVIILSSLGGVLFAFPGHEYKNVVVGYTLVLLFIGPPIETILLWVPSFSRANIALKKLQTLRLVLSSSAKEADSMPHPFRLRWNSLQLKDVQFTYSRDANDSSFSLCPIDLTFSRGETVFIVGGNGSGKSTLVKILSGLYYPDSGQVVFDDIVIDHTNIEWYRQHLSVVFSDVFLFDRLFGLEDPDLQTRANRYLARLRLDRFVTVKNGALSTTDLSHGQRKRLALLIAYLEDRPLYIFDEWAADQDPEFKKTFYLELIPELKAAGKTIIVVTHDAHYFRVADRVVRLEEGRLVDWEPQRVVPVSG